VSEEPPPVLLALSPVVEQSVAPLLFGEQAAVRVAASLVELAALERTLQDSGADAVALLVSADLSGFTPGPLSRARSYGLRVVGIARDEDDAALLRELPLDAVLTAPIDGPRLQAAVHASAGSTNNGAAIATAAPTSLTRGSKRRGTVLAVVGSRGSPGASELASSLAALASVDWRALLVELDLLGEGGLALRLGCGPAQGSLLALLRANATGEPALGELLERWLVICTGWPPVLLAPPDPGETIAELDEPGAIRNSLEAVADAYPLVIADVGFLLAQPGGIGAVERCHREALLAADAVMLTVGAREAQLDAGLAQLDLLLDQLEIPRERIRVVCNGVDGPGAIPRAQLEQTLTIGLRERELASDALVPWDARALSKAVRTGLPLAAAHPRGGYARTVRRLLDTLFLPGTAVARNRKRLLASPARPAVEPEQAAGREDEEVVLPWRS
jgi:Flp pilus assembly CpaE family ATPase